MKHLFLAPIFFVVNFFLAGSTSKEIANTKSENNKIKTESKSTLFAERIKTSFRSGNSQMLTTCLNNELELVIDTDKVQFPKISSTQAEGVLKAFFRKHPPTNFQYVYQGSSNASVSYNVANFRSGNKDYLVYLLIKRLGAEKYVVDTIQIKAS